MLERVEIAGYKSAYDVSLKLGRLTVLVGANGSGKTSILEAIAGAARAIRDPAKKTRALTDFGAENVESLLELVSWGAEEATITLHARPSQSFGYVRIRERPDGETFTVTADGSSTDPLDALAGPPEPLLLQLSPASIARASTVADDEPSLAPSGAHAGSVLDAMSRRQIDELGERLHSVIPDVQEVWAVRSNRGGSLAHEPAFTIDGHQVRARHASEGTVLVFGIVLAMLSVAGPAVVLLDDVQRGLHPKAQVDVVCALRRILVENPELQIVATTHSPYLVDQLRTEEVAVVVRREGRSHVRRLSEHPDAERWKGELRTGEFWSAVGEDWVADS